MSLWEISLPVRSGLGEVYTRQAWWLTRSYASEPKMRSSFRPPVLMRIVILSLQITRRGVKFHKAESKTPSPRHTGLRTEFYSLVGSECVETGSRGMDMSGMCSHDLSQSGIRFPG